MNHHEFRAAVATLRQAGTEVETALGVSEADLARWERGEAGLPRIRARQIRWLLDFQENAQRRAAAHLPVCAPAEALTARYQEKFAALSSGESSLAELEAFSAELEAHQSQCPTCTSNEAWERKHLRNPGPFPMPGVWGAVFGVAARVPQPLHFALIGAVILGGVVSVRLLFLVAVVVFRFPGPTEALALLGGGVLTVLAAAAAGAAGGLVIPVTAPLRRALGGVGHYLTGILVVEAYLWAIVALLPLALGEPVLEGPGEWKALTAFAAAFGVFGAFVHQRQERKERSKGATRP